MNEIKVFYLNAKKGCEVMTIEEDLHVFQRLIDCDAIDVCYRHVCGTKLCFIVDDEGFLKSDYVISAVSRNGKDALAGNLVITGCPDDEGRCTSVKDDDIINLVRRMCVSRSGHFAVILD